MRLSFYTIFCSFFILLPAVADAQERGNYNRNGGSPPQITIKGQIVDASDGAALEFATVTLFSKKDSSIVSGGITDETGLFVIETRPGRFYAKAEFIAYESLFIDEIPMQRGNPVVDLGVIQLQPSSATLQEVEVRAEKSQMQLALDKKVFNVGKDLANRGGSAQDILDNVPSVTVDIEGNVSLRGSQGVRILVDGKPSGLIGNGTNGLRQIPSNMIDRIEVITNPSARYEAEGMVGIINIILKKNNKKGLNGSLDLTAGQPDNYSTGINVNYRKNNFNFFTNIGAGYRKGPGYGTLYQETYSGDNTFISDQTRDMQRGGWFGNFRFGADYYFNEKNVLTTAFLYRRSNDDNLTTLEYKDYLNSLTNPTLFTKRTDDELEEEYKLEYALTYKKDFKAKGHVLTADIRYQDNTETENSDFTEQYYDGSFNLLGIPNLMQRSDNKESERQLIGQLDYTQPIGEHGKFELGYRGSFRTIKNDYLVEEFSDVAWLTLQGLSNNFIYDENINAIYAIYGNKIRKFSYQVGLRAEHSDVRTELEQTQEINPRDYFNIFPSAFLGYEFGTGNTVQLSYSRRLRRPRFWDLNPFLTFSDARNLFSGNPDLDPEYTDSYELGYVKYWDKASLSSSVYYRHSTDVIERITQPLTDSTFVTSPQNLSTQDDYGLEFTISLNPIKWWRFNSDLNFFRSITDGENIGSTFQADTYTMSGRATSIMTLFKNIDTQVRFNYRAPRETTQGSRKAIYTMDLGISRDILNKNGTITLSVRDLFNSRKRRYETFGENFYRSGEFQWRARQIDLNFNYRLNQNKRRGGNRGGGYQGGGEGEF